MDRKTQNQKNHNLNLIYQPSFVTKKEKDDLFKYLGTLFPIWERRFSDSNPPPVGETNRSLLRPVYWLGNWQFACLDYYHPPKGLENRCVKGEPYPVVLQNLVNKIENTVKQNFSPKDIPRGWKLNTCLINYYGNRIETNSAGESIKVDTARVGEHKDFEPGPIGSISFGEKALFQFVRSSGKQQKSDIVLQQWLEDSSLQIFGGDKFKKQLFHRVQRVEDKKNIIPKLNTTYFETRRINFTFRYVPTDHIQELKYFPQHLKNDVTPYVQQLALHSKYWQSQL